MRLWCRIAVQAVAWTVILAVGESLGAAVVVPRLVGATPYTVLTGSMRPALPPGTLVVVRPVEMDDISVGDTITYQLRSGEPTVVTHRVVGSGVRTDGTAVLTTRGDANQVSDARPVRQEQVRGRVWYAVPHLGRLSTALDPVQRRTAVHAVAAGLLLYSGWMVVAGLVARSAPGRRSAAKEQSR
ncbi:signal peptidase I [Aeromicrobium sp. Leaf245]|uniref:signal peptidase I n=1 Tax=Aeromicrobium sp. Leaf245 TaxID=1736306 RepID=UPI0006F38CD1|nr:signal peptidase I [Aeromicrobium sp. Leaf245]KQO38262.1 hypothetical protein ASF05_16550 [Aeromicrobium sp. Leaf245]